MIFSSPWTRTILQQQVVVVLLWLLLVSLCSISASSSSSDSYASVRALDGFGNSKQVEYAQQAASAGGRLALVAAATQDDESSSTIVVVSMGTMPLVHRISLHPNTDHHETDGMLALCGVGFQGDLAWLVHQLRTYCKTIWERYDSPTVSVSSIAHVVSHLMSRFQGYPVQDELWNPLLQPQTQDEEPQEWARPLGLDVLLLSTTSSSMLRVDPSGSIASIPTVITPSHQRISYVALGTKHSEQIQEQLKTSLTTTQNNNDDDDSTITNESPSSLLQEQLIQVLLLEAQQSNHHKNQVVPVMVETLQGSQIQQQVLYFQNGKQILS